MWEVNYSKCVNAGGSYNDGTGPTNNADGVLVFCNTYSKQRFNYEIKLYDSQGGIHECIH